MKNHDFITPVGDDGIYTLNTSTWRTHKPVMDKDICIECGICFSYCPVNSIKWNGGQYIIDYGFCKGCGICEKECPKEAIKMIKEKEDCK